MIYRGADLRVLSNYLQTARQLAMLMPTTPCVSTGGTNTLCTDGACCLVVVVCVLGAVVVTVVVTKKNCC